MSVVKRCGLQRAGRTEGRRGGGATGRIKDRSVALICLFLSFYHDLLIAISFSNKKHMQFGRRERRGRQGNNAADKGAANKGVTLPKRTGAAEKDGRSKKDGQSVKGWAQ